MLKFELVEAYQTAPWLERMHECGTSMQNHRVRHVYFTHGTFVGSSPLGIIDLFAEILEPWMIERLKILVKAGIDLIMDDTGNYTGAYIDDFQTALGQEIPCSAIIWDSGNYHLARLNGAMQLIETLASDIGDDFTTEDHLLLIGHSHAGQLYALLTTLLEDGNRAGQLLDIARQAGHDSDRILGHLDRIRRVHLDIATFGMPPRYPWGGQPDYTLRHIVNDRGLSWSSTPSYVLLNDLLHTIHGDYVQQWGREGTDFPAPSDLQGLNEELDKVLDEGVSPSKAIANLYQPERIPSPYGKTLKIDYDDSAGLLPNCIETLFGHGIYTRKQTMLFNTLLLVNEFYPS